MKEQDSTVSDEAKTTRAHLLSEMHKYTHTHNQVVLAAYDHYTCPFLAERTSICGGLIILHAYNIKQKQTKSEGQVTAKL